MLGLLCQFCDIIGLIFIVANGQINQPFGHTDVYLRLRMRGKERERNRCRGGGGAG